jgi:acetyltransferase-like isoleucine patch superfamily enzyme
MYGKVKFVLNAYQTALDILSTQKKNEESFSRFHIFFDILLFRLKYNASINKYLQLRYYSKTDKERINDNRILFKRKILLNNLKKTFKYMSGKYDKNQYMRNKRNGFYKEAFNMGENCNISGNVKINFKHENVHTKIICGNNVSVGKNVRIDITGGLEIGNGVFIAGSVGISTHGHDSLNLRKDSELIPYEPRRAYSSPLVIEDNVNIGAFALIRPGVGRIGENSIIMAGAVVTKRVPPNVVIAGNPAAIVFKFPAAKRFKNINK